VHRGCAPLPPLPPRSPLSLSPFFPSPFFSFIFSSWYGAAFCFCCMLTGWGWEASMRVPSFLVAANMCCWPGCPRVVLAVGRVFLGLLSCCPVGETSMEKECCCQACTAAVQVLVGTCDVNPVKNNETQQRKGTQDRSKDRF
jgi:hypothetical protein